MTKRLVIYFALLAFVLMPLWSADCLADQVLFFSGPDQLTYGNFGLPTIANPYAVTDQFTITGNSTVSQIGFSAWVLSGYTPTAVSWAVTETPGLSSVIADGIGNLSTSLTASGRQGGNDVYWSSFATNFALPAGTYWLWLTGGQPSNSAIGWGYTNNNGGSLDYVDPLGNGIYNQRLVLGGTQSFELSGSTAAPVPEPTTVVLLSIGLLGIKGVTWRRRRPTQPV